MTDGPNQVWAVLRALVDARSAHFQRLWIDACSAASRRSTPFIGFHVVNRTDGGVNLNLGVSLLRRDGVEVGWSVSVGATPSNLTIAAIVELTDDVGTTEPFGRSESVTDVDSAVRLVDALAAELCAQRSWLLG